MSSFNITYTSPANTITLGDWANDLSLDFTAPHIKKIEMYEVGEDALALSTTWKRLRDEKRSSTSRLLDGTLFKEITTVDRESAAEIRDYYSKKIMMLKLKSTTPITKYREDLNTFIHSDGLTIRSDTIGLIYRLPDFYKFDRAIEEVFMNANKKVKVYPNITASAKFTPIKRIERKTRNQNVIQYWMQEQTTGNAALISIQAKNPLESVWNSIFDNTKNLSLDCTKSTQRIDDHEYMLLSKWSLSKV